MDDKEKALDRIVRRVFKSLRYLLLFSSLVAIAGFFRYEWLSNPQRRNLWNLVVRTSDSSLSALSKTRLGFFYEGLFGAVVTAVVVFFLLRLISPNEEVVSHAKNTLLALLVGLLVPSFIFSSTFAWKLITAMYDDHHDNTGRWQAAVNEKESLKVGLRERDEYIKRLEVRSCPVCSKQPRAQPAPNVIGSLAIKVFTRCTLRNAAAMPSDIFLEVFDTNDASYLKGPVGNSYLDATQNVSYKRGDDNMSATFVETYTLRPTSSLMGEPIAALRNYIGSISLWAVNMDSFSVCDFIETTVVVNGTEALVTRSSKAITIPMSRGKTLTLNLPLGGIKVPKQ